MEGFNRNLSVEGYIFCEVDTPKAAAANEPLDSIMTSNDFRNFTRERHYISICIH